MERRSGNGRFVVRCTFVLYLGSCINYVKRVRSLYCVHYISTVVQNVDGAILTIRVYVCTGGGGGLVRSGNFGVLASLSRARSTLFQ